MKATIKLKLNNDKKLELDLNEARTLWAELDQLFGNKQSGIPGIPIQPWPCPETPLQPTFPWEPIIYCAGTTTK